MEISGLCTAGTLIHVSPIVAPEMYASLNNVWARGEDSGRMLAGTIENGSLRHHATFGAYLAQAKGSRPEAQALGGSGATALEGNSASRRREPLRR